MRLPRLTPSSVVHLLLSSSVLPLLVTANVHQGNGIKIGEVTDRSAIIWTRLTTTPEAHWSGAAFLEPTVDGNREAVKAATAVARESAMSSAAAKAQKSAAAAAGMSQGQLHQLVMRADWRSQLPDGRSLSDMLGSLPGTAGTVRVIATPAKGGAPIETAWSAVDPKRDHTRQVALHQLQPATTYRVHVESRDSAGKPGASLTGSFRTAPSPDTVAPISFAVVTCGDYPRRDDPANGHRIYDTLHRLKPDFLVHTGDIEYYDKPDPWATSSELARFKWNRLFALPYQRTFHRHTPVYFTYDDHDILKNDCWPGQTYGSLTWDQGLAIFDEQTPVSPLPYRTFRHGRDVQIWVVEGRRFRSPNTDADGPAKTILGPEQKAWLLRTLAESDASFKILLSPTPIVGPDRATKNDNHANPGFRHEGDELRRFLGAQKNLIVACGDRHWQYYSVDPVTGTREFGCGPSSDVHAGGYTPQPSDAAIQKFFRLKGGFLTIASDRDSGKPRLRVRHHDVAGDVVHEVTIDGRSAN